MKEFSLLNGQIQGVRWGEGVPVLALHGFLDNAMSFKGLADSLKGIEIWAIDLPGHGLSKALPAVDGLFMLQWLPILGRVLDELDWSQFHILGHSMGAILSQLLAAADPRVTALYSLDGFGPIASSLEDNRRRFQSVYDGRQKTFPVRYYDSYQALVRSRCSGVFPLSEHAAAVMAKRAVGYSDKGWFHRYDRRLRADSIWRLNEEDVLMWLSNVKCPIHLLLFGAQDWPSYKSVFEQRVSVVKQLDVTFMQGSHHQHMESPQQVADWLQPLLLL